MTRLAQEQGDGCQVRVRVDQNPPDYLVLDSLGLRGKRELAIGGLGGLAAHERPSKELERPPCQIQRGREGTIRHFFSNPPRRPGLADRGIPSKANAAIETQTRAG